VRSHVQIASMLAAAAALALAIRGAEGGGRGAQGRGQALPEAPRASGVTGGLAVLRAPLSAQVQIAGGQIQMGSPPSEVIEAVAICRREAPVGLCELPQLRETQLFQHRFPMESLFQNEFVLHAVQLSSFWMDRREVTVEEYARCVKAGPCAAAPYAQGGARFARPELPVSLVTWEDARTYCRWRGGRLPTEAEWERAARGLRGRRFPWGNEYNRMVANHGSMSVTFTRRFGDEDGRLAAPDLDGRDGHDELAPVGSYPAGRTPEGLDDMAGNVAEWVADTFDLHYDAIEAVNPTGPATTATPFKVIRGGSYLHAAPWMRGAARLMAPADERQSWIGFRCAREVR
jgi:formylglycine-generating enzyme